MMKEYIPPTLTVDNVVLTLESGKLAVLLIKRTNEPFKGIWALPGGYNAAGETTTDAMERILLAKAGLAKSQLRHVEQLYTFDTVARDPRGHAVSVTYLSVGENLHPKKTSEVPTFFPVTDLPQLAFDHKHIIEYAHERYQSRITYTNAIFALLPKRFTLTQLQRAYEAVFCRELDKRNFRKKFLSLELIHETDETYRVGAHRPARMYEFNKQSLEILSRSFD